MSWAESIRAKGCAIICRRGGALGEQTANAHPTGNVCLAKKRRYCLYSGRGNLTADGKLMQFLSLEYDSY